MRYLPSHVFLSSFTYSLIWGNNVPVKEKVIPAVNVMSIEPVDAIAWNNLNFIKILVHYIRCLSNFSEINYNIFLDLFIILVFSTIFTNIVLKKKKKFDENYLSSQIRIFLPQLWNGFLVILTAFLRRYNLNRFHSAKTNTILLLLTSCSTPLSSFIILENRLQISSFKNICNTRGTELIIK